MNFKLFYNPSRSSKLRIMSSIRNVAYVTYEMWRMNGTVAVTVSISGERKATLPLVFSLPGHVIQASSFFHSFLSFSSYHQRLPSNLWFLSNNYIEVYVVVMCFTTSYLFAYHLSLMMHEFFSELQRIVFFSILFLFCLKKIFWNIPDGWW